MWCIYFVGPRAVHFLEEVATVMEGGVQPEVLLVWTVRGYWLAAAGFYLAKMAIPSLNRLTLYGKQLYTLERGVNTVVDQCLASCNRRPPSRWSLPHGTGFTLFYVLGSIWNASIVTILSIAKISPSLLPFSNVIPMSFTRFLPSLIFVQIHLLRRVAECYFVHSFSPNRMTLFNFVAGASFYAALPLSFFDQHDESAQPLLSPYIYNGLALTLFICGSYIQATAHIILANLRLPRRIAEDQFKSSGGGVYRVPYGGFFKYVSCPHYFGEILIYSSFVVASRLHNPSLWLALAFVVLNLSHSASITHAWYQKEFDRSYPPDRKRIIPYLF